MTAPIVRIVYLEFGRSRAPLAWRDDVLLSEEQAAERQELHRAMADIVRDAGTDRTAAWGRVVRSGETLLVETRLDDAEGYGRLDVTTVLDAPGDGLDWPAAGAVVAKVLGDQGVTADPERLAVVFERAWREARPRAPFDMASGRRWAVFGALGVALLIWRIVRARHDRSPHG
jgi:hypothetical protein